MKKPRILVENPFTYIDSAKDADWSKIRDYYGIEESKANRYVSGRAFCASNLLYRSSGEEGLRRRQFYYTNHFVKDLIVHNTHRGKHTHSIPGAHTPAYRQLLVCVCISVCLFSVCASWPIFPFFIRCLVVLSCDTKAVCIRTYAYDSKMFLSLITFLRRWMEE